MAKSKNSNHYGVDGPWTSDEVRFVTAYFEVGMSKSEAAARVFGSKPPQATKVGEEVFGRPHVRKALGKLFTKGLAELNTAIHQDVLERWRIEAFTDRASLYNDDWSVKPLSEWSEEQKLLLESVAYQTNALGDVIPAVKLASRDKALISLARAAGVLLAHVDGANDFDGEVRAVKDKVAKVALKAAKAIEKARAEIEKKAKSLKGKKKSKKSEDDK